MNELLRAVAEKERRLETELLSAKPIPRRSTLWPFLLAVAMTAAASAVDALAVRWRAQIDFHEMKRALATGPIPWQRYIDDQKCDVWLSARGLAEIRCPGKEPYEGMGISDGDGFHSWAPGGELPMSALRPVSAVAPWPPLPFDAEVNMARMERFVNEEVVPCIATNVRGKSPKLWLDTHDQILHALATDLRWIVHSQACLEHVVRGWQLPRLTGEPRNYGLAIRVAEKWMDFELGGFGGLLTWRIATDPGSSFFRR